MLQTAATPVRNPRFETAPQSYDAITIPLLVSMHPRRPVLLVGKPKLSASAAILHRFLNQRATLLVWSTGAPRPWQLVQRMALRFADAVFTTDESTAAVIAVARGSSAAVFNMPGPYEFDAFLGQPPRRDAGDAYRIVVRGELRPAGNALHILQSAALWAEHHPDRRIEVCWIGSGDLQGVLAAQSLPANLLQSFPGPMTNVEAAREFGRSGILIDGLSHDAVSSGLFAEAMASGLIVIFDQHRCVDSAVLEHGVSGIAFDSQQPTGLLTAITHVMTCSTEMLDDMRDEARIRIRLLEPHRFDARLARTIEMVIKGRETSGRAEPNIFAAPTIAEIG